MRCNENLLTNAYGKSILRSYHSMLSPGKREYREHHHTECELSLFLTGSGVYAVHGKELSFGAGDVFLFGSNEAHCITEIHEDFDLLNIHFESKLLWEHPETVELLNLFAARNKQFCNRFPATDTELKRLILALEAELVQKQPCYELKARELLFSVLIHMIRRYDYIDPKKILSAHSSQTGSINAAMQYINENLEKKLTLQQLSALACMTPTYFSSVFKRLNGVSPWEYITIKRVERAIDMLKHTEQSKLEIAAKCGFSSSSNFYKAFHQITGKRPSDYT